MVVCVYLALLTIVQIGAPLAVGAAGGAANKQLTLCISMHAVIEPARPQQALVMLALPLAQRQHS